MSSIREVVVVNGVRTAIGDYGGSLKNQAPVDLATGVIAEVVRRSGVSADAVGACVLGNVIHTEARDMYISRVAAITAAAVAPPRVIGGVAAPVASASSPGR